MRAKNENGLKLVKAFEGCSLTAYLDNATPPVITIGWGRTHHGITMSSTCTQEEADAWLMQDLHAEGAHFIDAWVKAPLNDNQYAALTSFIYNVGCGTFKRSMVFSCLGNTTKPDYETAAHALLAYDWAGGEHLPGLARRRRAERALFLGDIETMDKEIST